MNKSKVYLSIIAAVAVGGIAYSQFMQPEDKATTTAKPTTAPVSMPAPMSSDVNAPTAKTLVSKSNQADNLHQHKASNNEAPKPPQAENKNESTIRSTLTARQQDLPKDHRQDHQHARPHGHEEHTNPNQPRRPPGEPKKPVPDDNAPRG